LACAAATRGGDTKHALLDGYVANRKKGIREGIKPRCPRFTIIEEKKSHEGT